VSLLFKRKNEDSKNADDANTAAAAAVDHLSEQLGGASKSFVQLVETVSKPRFICRRLMIDGVDLTLELHASQVLRYLHLGAGRMPLALSEISLRNVNAPIGQLAKQLAAQYLADAILAAPIILGSLQILGNPTFLVQSLISGVTDFVTLPTHALARGPTAFLSAVVGGTLSLFRHASEGTLSSLSSLSSSLARNLDRLSNRTWSSSESENGPKTASQVQNVDAHSTPSPASSKQVTRTPKGLITGVSKLASGAWGGLAGVLEEPVRGAYSGGAWGFLQGVGSGLVGAVARPISGALDLVAHTSQGLVDISAEEPVGHRPTFGAVFDMKKKKEDDSKKSVDFAADLEWRYSWSSFFVQTLSANNTRRDWYSGHIVGLQLLRFPRGAQSLVRHDFEKVLANETKMRRGGGGSSGLGTTRSSVRVVVLRIQRRLSFAESDIGDAGVLLVGKDGAVVVGSDGQEVQGCRYGWGQCRIVAFCVQPGAGASSVYIVTFVPKMNDADAKQKEDAKQPSSQNVDRRSGSGTETASFNASSNTLLSQSLSAGIICTETEWRRLVKLVNLQK